MSGIARFRRPNSDCSGQGTRGPGDAAHGPHTGSQSLFVRVLGPILFAFIGCSTVLSARASEFVPAGSEVGALQPGEGLHLLSALEVGSFVKPDGWRMGQFAVEKSTVPAKLGRDALLFRGTAAEAAKGDFDIGGPLPGETLAFGCWFHLTEDANVREVGFQFHDNEGEALQYLVPADWTGWKWVETPVTAAALKQAYPQRDKNGAHRHAHQGRPYHLVVQRAGRQRRDSRWGRRPGSPS